VTLKIQPGLTPDEQLKRWLEGSSQHLNTNGECCPDFSCCFPELLWSVERRAAFVRAIAEKDESTKGRMLVEALNALIERMAQNKKVHVVR
jgi:hypothetical protein